MVIASCGGGSNLGGIALPFMTDSEVRLVAVEPASCPTLTEGRFDYDFGDTVGMTPLLPMYTLGHEFMPPTIHAGGLRYHGDAPIISNLVKSGRMEAMAYPQGKTFEAAVTFANTEGKLPAPETGHAIRAAIDEALACKETGEEKVILFNYSGPRPPRPRRVRRLPERPLDRRLERNRATAAAAPHTGCTAGKLRLNGRVGPSSSGTVEPTCS